MLKALISTAIFALLSVGSAHAANVFTAGDLINDYSTGNSQFVIGYVAGIAEADDKVCSAKPFGTLALQVVTYIQVSINENLSS